MEVSETAALPHDIPLTQGKVAIVDTDDYERLSQYRWCAAKDRHGKFRAQAYIDGHTTPMSRFVMNCEYGDGKIVDHINGDTLDNRRENLRLATNSQNSANRPSNNGTGYKGIYTRNGKFCAQIVLFLGSFNTVEEAAKAYDDKAREIWGEYAYTNF